MSIITLLTDFGLKDGNVGVMKGVIWKIAPEAQIADLSHLIPPQDVQDGALILSRSAPYFPPGTVHVAVVDPGVGTTRRPIAARLGGQFFVLPDNGLITLLLEQAEAASEIVEFVHLDQAQYWLPAVSHVFHGRDIFAPSAAHLANGVLLTELGTPIHDPQRLKFPVPTRTDLGLLGEVIHIDHFGNLSTSIRRQHLGELAAFARAPGGGGDRWTRAHLWRAPVRRIGGSLRFHGLSHRQRGQWQRRPNPGCQSR